MKVVATYLGGRRPQTSKGGNRGKSDAVARQTLWGFRCCIGALTAFLGSGRWLGEFVLSIAIGRTSVAPRRLINKAVVRGGATASMVIAGREPAKQKCTTGMFPQTDLIMMYRS